MNEFEQSILDPDSSDSPENYRALDDEKTKAEPTSFTPEQQSEIEHKRRILSSLAYFIGKDFRIPVELNQPGAGWHWDFKANIIRVDPKDLLDKPIDYLRFVISHEGGHRRMSRTEFIPLETWNQPGFSFMMNAIEDPRTNNFVAEAYPKFQEQMGLAYQQDLDFEQKSKEKAQQKLGQIPRFMQAGFEYIKQWFRERQGQDFQISEDLPDEAKTVVRNTLASAQDSWWRYPSRDEADQEELISRYAERSYDINLNQIWPEFKKLVEKDMEDQKTQEFLKDSEQGQGQGLPQELKDKLTPEEQQSLEEAIEKALEEAKKQQGEGKEGQPVPIDMNSLSPELKQKIKDYIDSLPEEQRKELEEKAKSAVRDFQKELDEDLEGKLSDSPEKKEARAKDQEEPKPLAETEKRFTEGETDSVKKYREQIEQELKKDANVYEEKRREVLDIINKLENELRAIFRERRERRWETGKKSGPNIDIQHRIGEIAQGILAIDSRAWQRRERPAEKDYAITLLVDLSGSMQGHKIDETFKAVIALTEVLNRLSIRTEILGFNDRIYEYQKFGDHISNDTREKMGGMLQEVDDTSDTGKAQWNDDGWALEQASDRLNHQKEDEKFLIVLSDGTPEESPIHRGSQYELSKIVQEIMKDTKQKLIGLGIGRGTDHVNHYYPNSLANVNVQEMAEKLSALIKEAIEHYERF